VCELRIILCNAHVQGRGLLSILHVSILSEVATIYTAVNAIKGSSTKSNLEQYFLTR
jgi:hypothetical protein